MTLNYKYIIISFCALNFNLCAETYFSDTEKKELLPVMTKDCYVKQRAAPVNKKMTNKQLTNYCECLMGEVLNTPNAKEVFKGINNGDISPTYYKNTLISASKYCGKKVMK